MYERWMMRRNVYPARMRAAFLVMIAFACLTGCSKRSGDAVVLAKEHIEAAVASGASVAPTPTGGNDPVVVDQRSDDGTITVDSYIMKPEVRGTSRDPRALEHEQWLLKVRLIGNGRILNVPADRAQFDKLREGDRVRVRYQVGKYTGTVWGAEIIDK